ncbi:MULTISPECIES: hypothetical protein [Bacillus]|uniref:Uncharacterized protein n=1 Tax=Bacillus capparidis TaxID=1840411 RepID=A0ABS4CYF1_9BACI|nr:MULTISPECIES: hypothetical protein [Bacillus]MBP1082398.1 hypothetical protein [Bacillus capparidis]MED1097347.1 hypothetical protein [Bacillus capparidis]
MKTILWATLTANGNYAQSSPENPPKKEVLDDFATQAKAVGNFIVGRRTFEGVQVEEGLLRLPILTLLFSLRVSKKFLE